MWERLCAVLFRLLCSSPALLYAAPLLSVTRKLSSWSVVAKTGLHGTGAVPFCVLTITSLCCGCAAPWAIRATDMDT